MSSELLQKEDEFYKENEALELRTKDLMQKVNDVMKIQDNIIRETLKTNTDLEIARRSNNITKSYVDYSKNFGQNDVEMLSLPPQATGIGPKALSHIYKAKLQTVQTEHYRLEIDYKKKCDELRKLQKDNQSLLEEKDKWFSMYNSVKNTIGKLEAQNTVINSKLQTKDSENIALKKEIDTLKKDLKNINLNLHNCEIRLTRSYEENEKLKLALKNSKSDEKETKEAYRKQINDLTATVKQIEKHKSELLNGFKKQMHLIDNLKKQKMQLEALKTADLKETDFIKILNYNLS